MWNWATCIGDIQPDKSSLLAFASLISTYSTLMSFKHHETLGTLPFCTDTSMYLFFTRNPLIRLARTSNIVPSTSRRDVVLNWPRSFEKPGHKFNVCFSWMSHTLISMKTCSSTLCILAPKVLFLSIHENLSRHSMYTSSKSFIPRYPWKPAQVFICKCASGLDILWNLLRYISKACPESSTPRYPLNLFCIYRIFNLITLNIFNVFSSKICIIKPVCVCTRGIHTPYITRMYWRNSVVPALLSWSLAHVGSMTIRKGVLFPL